MMYFRSSALGFSAAQCCFISLLLGQTLVNCLFSTERMSVVSLWRIAVVLLRLLVHAVLCCSLQFSSLGSICSFYWAVKDVLWEFVCVLCVLCPSVFRFNTFFFFSGSEWETEKIERKKSDMFLFCFFKQKSYLVTKFLFFSI